MVRTLNSSSKEFKKDVVESLSDIKSNFKKLYDSFTSYSLSLYKEAVSILVFVLWKGELDRQEKVLETYLSTLTRNKRWITRMSDLNPSRRSFRRTHLDKMT